MTASRVIEKYFEGTPALCEWLERDFPQLTPAELQHIGALIRYLNEMAQKKTADFPFEAFRPSGKVDRRGRKQRATDDELLLVSDWMKQLGSGKQLNRKTQRFFLAMWAKRFGYSRVDKLEDAIDAAISRKIL